MAEENKKPAEQKETQMEPKIEEKKPVETPEVQAPGKKSEKKPAIKKEFAIANGKDLPISLKHAKFICRFIKGKSIEQAMQLMAQVSTKKIYVPMNGELACRKKGIKGRYPVKASLEFIRILKSLQGNANVSGLLEPVITEAISNKASLPHRKGGLRFKRAHVLLEVRERQESQSKDKPQKKQNKVKEKSN